MCQTVWVQIRTDILLQRLSADQILAVFSLFQIRTRMYRLWSSQRASHKGVPISSYNVSHTPTLSEVLYFRQYSLCFRSMSHTHLHLVRSFTLDSILFVSDQSQNVQSLVLSTSHSQGCPDIFLQCLPHTPTLSEVLYFRQYSLCFRSEPECTDFGPLKEPLTRVSRFLPAMCPTHLHSVRSFTLDSILFVSDQN